MKQFRKKPVIVEAIQYTRENWDQCREFLGLSLHESMICDHPAPVGSWIAKTDTGAFLVIQPAEFAANYEPVEEEGNPAQGPVNTCTPEEATPPAPIFKACVVVVGDNKALNALVQRELFAHGYQWIAHGREVMFTESREIITDENGCIYRHTRDDSKRRFDLTADFPQEWLAFLDSPAEVSVPIGSSLKAVEVGGLFKKGTFKVAIPAGGERVLYLKPDTIDAIYAASQKARQK